MEIEGELVLGSLEPILSREIWERVQARFASRATGVDARGRHPAARYLLDRPLDVRCGVCGGRIRPRTVHRRGRPTLYRYVCVSKHDRAACSMSRFPREDVDALLVGLFSGELIDEKATLEAIEKAARSVLADAERVLREAEREATRTEERLARVRRDYTDGGLTLAEWREFKVEIASEHGAALAEVERLRRHVGDLKREGPIRSAQRALHALMDEVRSLAECYDPVDGMLVEALRTSIAKVVEEIVVHPLPKPSHTRSTRDGGRSVFLRSGELLVEIVARESLPQGVELADGTCVHVDLPYFEPVGLERADNASFASLKGYVPSEGTS